MVLAKKPINNK